MSEKLCDSHVSQSLVTGAKFTQLRPIKVSQPNKMLNVRSANCGYLVEPQGEKQGLLDAIHF